MGLCAIAASDGALGRKALCKKACSGGAPDLRAHFFTARGVTARGVAQREAEGSKMRPAVEGLSKIEDQSQGRTEHVAQQHKMDKATAAAREKRGRGFLQ